VVISGQTLLRIGGSAGAIKRLVDIYYKQVVPLELGCFEELRRSNLFIVKRNPTKGSEGASSNSF
jgi:hypothetical protein